VVRFESVSVNYTAKNDATNALRGVAPDVLRDISFDLAEGSFRWLLGPAGSGKTTLLRLINMSLRPSRGEVIIFNTRVGAARRRMMPHFRRQIGAIFSDSRLLPNLSAFNNVALPLRLFGRPVEQIRADVMEMLGWMGLTEKLASMPQDLSEGERQRVMIARAVIGRPRLLLADEPTSALDNTQSERVIHLLRELNRLGSTVIIATHNESLVEHYPGAALHLSDSSLVEVG
jgi:cell division transport system ATP-binding protein